MSRRRSLLAIDVGGTKTAVAVQADERGAVPESIVFPTGRTGDETLEVLLREARALIGDHMVSGIGVSFGGHVNDRDLFSLHVPGWERADLLGSLEVQFDAPAIAVNDGEAGALGEYAARAALGACLPTFAYVTVSTGIGGAFLLDGRPFRGAHGLSAEIGHMVVAETGVCSCGRIGHLEARASGTAIARRARSELVDLAPSEFPAERCGTLHLTARDVAQAAKAGNGIARTIIGDAGREVGRALATVALLIDPDVVVVGGGVAQSGGAFWGPLRAAVDEHVLRPLTVELASHGSHSALFGALQVARSASAAVATRQRN